MPPQVPTPTNTNKRCLHKTYLINAKGTNFPSFPSKLKYPFAFGISRKFGIDNSGSIPKRERALRITKNILFCILFLGRGRRVARRNQRAISLMTSFSRFWNPTPSFIFHLRNFQHFRNHPSKDRVKTNQIEPNQIVQLAWNGLSLWSQVLAFISYYNGTIY